MISFLMVCTRRAAWLLLMLSCAVGVAEPRGDLVWPEAWRVYAPLEQNDPLPDPAFLSDPSEVIELPAYGDLPARRIEPRILKVAPGTPHDLAALFPVHKVGNTALVVLELQSPTDQTVTLGLGADWWLQAWLNGELIFDTVSGDQAGNNTFPIEMLNHRVEVSVKRGRNLLVARIIGGKASATLALGGPQQFAVVEQRLASQADAYRLNASPGSFAERQVLPLDTQALLMARRGLKLPVAEADLAAGALVGLQPLPARQPVLEHTPDIRPRLIDRLSPQFEQPITLLLAKERYPAEDRHLDALVWTTPGPSAPALAGQLEVVLEDKSGATLARHTISDLSPSGLFFSLGLPPELTGSSGSLSVIWRAGETELGRARQRFRVAKPLGTPTEGRIPLTILNEPRTHLRGAPMTVGVPFPLGALQDDRQLRLVDETGEILPLQTLVTARWSRFGSIKWVLCDFTVDLAGEPRELALEFGPEIRRPAGEPLAVTLRGDRFPLVNAGLLQIGEDGLARADELAMLALPALSGAYVTHADGTTYTMPEETETGIEEIGSEKVVIRRTGWYTDAASGERFCQFVTRFTLHRASPIVRLHHTWIYTGDDKQDPIRHMGWRFPSAGPIRPEGILTGFEGGQWVPAPYLVQHDYQAFRLPGDTTDHPGRTPGVLATTRGHTRLLFGAKDFWQNFPSELQNSPAGFTFANWPEHNPPPATPAEVPASEAFRNRWLHEGELLDFRLPDSYLQGDIWRIATHDGTYPLWDKGRAETANAQGIARTEEMLLYLADATTPPEEAARVMRGLDDETLRAVVDPAWLCASGAFGQIHHRAPELWPKAERSYEAGAYAPARWVERLGFYGMWLHGDYPTWSMNLEQRTASAYRTLRKNHLREGWPFDWIPFARSGNPDFFKLALAATRQMSDVNVCHYATPEVEAAMGKGYFRRQGWWDKPAVIPWVGYAQADGLRPGKIVGGTQVRTLTGDVDYLWHAWYLAGEARARDVALLIGTLLQHDYEAIIGPRDSQSILPACLDLYQATWEPWYLLAAHRIAQLHQHLYSDSGEVAKHTFWPDSAGHTWRPADQIFYRYTRSEAHRRIALNNAVGWTSLRQVGSRIQHSRGYGGSREWLAGFAYELTGDPFYHARAAATLDSTVISFYNGDVDYLIGNIGFGFGSNHGNRTGVAVPRLLWMRQQFGDFPEPIHDPIFLFGEAIGENPSAFDFRLPTIFLRKEPGTSPTLFLDTPHRGRHRETSVWPQKPHAPYRYHLQHRDSPASLQGDWRAPTRFSLPADAPAGVYRLVLTGRIVYANATESRAQVHRDYGQVYVPVSNEQQPEVLTFPAHPQMGGTAVDARVVGYWFLVPEGSESFWIDFEDDRTGRVAVWRPDGSLAWDRSYADGSPPRVEIGVLPGQDGRLWRATGGRFVLDPRIPPYFSIHRAKWFNPED